MLLLLRCGCFGVYLVFGCVAGVLGLWLITDLRLLVASSIRVAVTADVLVDALLLVGLLLFGLGWCIFVVLLGFVNWFV